MDAATRKRCEQSSVVFDGEVLWTRCLTCGAPLLRPSSKYWGSCRNQVACFLRYYRAHVREVWRFYRDSL